jgi:hypothetical protein
MLLGNLDETLARNGVDQRLLQGSYTAVLEVLSDGRGEN